MEWRIAIGPRLGFGEEPAIAILDDRGFAGPYRLAETSDCHASRSGPAFLVPVPPRRTRDRDRAGGDTPPPRSAPLACKSPYASPAARFLHGRPISRRGSHRLAIDGAVNGPRRIRRQGPPNRPRPTDQGLLRFRPFRSRPRRRSGAIGMMNRLSWPLGLSRFSNRAP